MIISLPALKYKEKVLGLLAVVLFFGSVYFYLDYLQQSYNSAQHSGERCTSELSSVKYQLNVVTEYKNRLDKLLSEGQKDQDNQKAIFKDIMDGCIALRQQIVICQSQFEDLQIESKKLKEEYDKAVKEIENLKTTVVAT